MRRRFGAETNRYTGGNVDVRTSCVSAFERAGMWWLMFWVCAAVFVLVLGALALALRRRASITSSRPSERSLTMGVAAATGITIAVLFGLLFASVSVGRAIGSRPGIEPLVIQITGLQ